MSTINPKDLYAQYEKDQPVLLPEGTHRLEIKTAKVEEKQKGPQIFCTYTVVGGPNDGRRVTAGGYSLTHKSAGIFFQNMAGWGFGADYFKGDWTMESLTQSLVGRVADVYLTVDNYGGREKNAVKIGAIKLVGIKDAAGVVKPVGDSAPAQQPQQPQPPATPPTPPPAPPAAETAPPPPNTEAAPPAAPPVPQPEGGAPPPQPAPTSDEAPF